MRALVSGGYWRDVPSCSLFKLSFLKSLMYIVISQGNVFTFVVSLYSKV